jgi:hypothetical protein
VSQGLHVPDNFWRSALFVLVTEVVTLGGLWLLQTSFSA